METVLFREEDEGHEVLLDTPLKHEGSVLISGYETELYDSMFAIRFGTG